MDSPHKFPSITIVGDPFSNAVPEVWNEPLYVEIGPNFISVGQEVVSPGVVNPYTILCLFSASSWLRQEKSIKYKFGLLFNIIKSLF